jgi:hypothetical protein
MQRASDTGDMPASLAVHGAFVASARAADRQPADGAVRSAARGRAWPAVLHGFPRIAIGRTPD